MGYHAGLIIFDALTLFDASQQGGITPLGCL